MISVLSIQDDLTEYQDHLDELLQSVQQWHGTAFGRDCWQQFLSELKWYLVIEGDILFPLFEKKTGTTGLTAILRAEQGQIKERVAALGQQFRKHGIGEP